MRRVMLAMAAVAALAACGGGDDDTVAVGDEAVTTETASATEATQSTDAAVVTEAPVVTEVAADTTSADTAPAAAAGSMVVPGADTDICAMFTAEELSAVVGMPLEVGEPFFSGGDENSCTWSTPSSSEVIGSVSIRLAGAGSFVIIDTTPYPLDGLGDAAEVENKYGQTNVHYGDYVVTFQSTGTPAELADIAAAHPDLAAEPDSVLVTTADSQASVALAQSFASRFTG